MHYVLACIRCDTGHSMNLKAAQAHQALRMRDCNLQRVYVRDSEQHCTTILLLLHVRHLQTLTSFYAKMMHGVSSMVPVCFLVHSLEHSQGDDGFQKRTIVESAYKNGLQGSVGKAEDHHAPQCFTDFSTFVQLWACGCTANSRPKRLRHLINE